MNLARLRLHAKSFRSTPSENLLIQFLEAYLTQPGYEFHIQGTQEPASPDDGGLLLFDGPEHQLLGFFRAPSTLAMDAAILIRPREEVLAVIKTKLDASRAAFAKASA